MDLEPIYVMLADDDENDRMFFIEAFEEIKMKTVVQTFKDGVELTNHLLMPELIIPHVLFLDLNMPLKGGMECLVEIRQNNRFKDMAIAIYSTSASEEDIEDTFVKGANVYIKKPSDFNQLKKLLTKVISMNWQYHTSWLNKEIFLLNL